ncbi:hypothetical protein ENTCAN_05613 [Enterobacter cancerogenus ATCC 35316]|nr:hypothetical protein ENTCAN_05613 [Enterobacter cancerogenus ATCC 35316]
MCFFAGSPRLFFISIIFSSDYFSIFLKNREQDGVLLLEQS